MADEAEETGTTGAHRDVKADLDERRIAKGVAVGLPLATAITALGVAATLGAPLAILVMAAGLLLGVIALFWASLRILSGDASLPPELEALDATAHSVDALASRKKMLVRALKDLDNERALGKLEDDDYEQLSHTYRGELKALLARIDASLAPHRTKAEDAARAYLAEIGLGEGAEKAKKGKKADKADKAKAASESSPELDREGAAKSAEEDDDASSDDSESKDDDASNDEPASEPKPDARVACSKCATSNEPDATFCKKCGTSLAKKQTASETADETATKTTSDAETESSEAPPKKTTSDAEVVDET